MPQIWLIVSHFGHMVTNPYLSLYPPTPYLARYFHLHTAVSDAGWSTWEKEITKNYTN
jgi:hypothetical protein